VFTLILGIIGFMSWSSRFGGWSGRFSPFSRSPTSNAPQVTDNDFSYITSEDLQQSQAEDELERAIKHSSRPKRETDALIFKHRRVSYPVHFPAYSIDDGELSIGKMREAVAKKLNVSPVETSRIKLFYRGKNLKDDFRTAREEGLRSDGESELLVVVGEPIPKESSESDDDEDDELGNDDNRRKKKRNKKRKNRGKKSSTSGSTTPNSYIGTSVNPDATYAPAVAPLPRTSAPQPPKMTLSPMQKLESLADIYRNKLLPECEQFLSNPPTDKAKRAFDHKRLTETILTQVLIALDGVSTEGNDDLRQQRKALVKDVQGMLNQLDDAIN
jgi:hypothetical protein